MKPIRLATLAIAAAGGLWALAASAAPIATPAIPEVNSSLVTPVYYCCWWSYGYKRCSYNCGGYKKRAYKRYSRYNY